MSWWQVALFAYGAVWAVVGLGMVAWYRWERWLDRREVARAADLFDRTFAAEAGFDLESVR